jgi:integrase
MISAPTRTTLAEAAAEWLAAAKVAVVRTRAGSPYKPSALRAHEEALRIKILPELGHLRLSAVTRAAVQDLVDRLVATGKSPSTVRNAILPLRAIYRRAISRSEVALNPTLGLALPAPRGTRERIAPPREASELLEVLTPEDRPVWALALYAGLRRGEIRTLRWSEVDFERGLIRVEQSWDDREGPIEPKSRAGRRRVPLAKPLRGELAAHKLRVGGGGGELVFGREDGRAINTDSLSRRARSAWRKAGLFPIGLHECRHTYAAFMIAAGVNAKALSTYMGHSSITVTLDRYGHLLPAHEDEAAAMLDAYLERELAR